MLDIAIHPIVFSLLVIGVFFLITFSFFTFVFIIHRRLLQNQYQIEEKFNQIAQFLAVNKFQYLEALSKSNVQLKNLMNQIKEGKQLFEKQFDIVRQKIISLTLINIRYLYLRSYRLTKEIKKDLQKCELMVENLRNISISATEYSKNISDLLVEYRQITEDVNHFYKFNLALRYPHEFFYHMYDSIKNIISQAAEFVVKFDNKKLLEILYQLNEKVSIYYQIVLQLYTLDKVLMYLESLRKRIKDSLDEATKILSSTDYSSIETTFANGSSNITMLSENLKLLKFDTAKNNAIMATKQLTDVLTKIEMGDHTNVLIQKDMNILRGQITILNKDFNSLNSAFNNIQHHFGHVRDGSIINKITNLNSEIKAIALTYQSLETEFNNYSLIQRTEFLLKIKELSERIVH
jgi:archaellum component FlaC